jgi:hypothetical protein
MGTRGVRASSARASWRVIAGQGAHLRIGERMTGAMPCLSLAGPLRTALDRRSWIACTCWPGLDERLQARGGEHGRLDGLDDLLPVHRDRDDQAAAAEQEQRHDDDDDDERGLFLFVLIRNRRGWWRRRCRRNVPRVFDGRRHELWLFHQRWNRRWNRRWRGRRREFGFLRLAGWQRWRFGQDGLRSGWYFCLLRRWFCAHQRSTTASAEFLVCADFGTTFMTFHRSVFLSTLL